MSRPFDPAKDLKGLLRVWSEIGWFDDSPVQRRGVEAYLSACDTLVEEVNGDIEVGVSRTDGSMRVLDETLPLCVIAGVYTGLSGRHGGHATRMTAEQVAAGVAQGAQVASLGIFDQGFYDRLGFGCGPYAHRRTIEPSSLKVPRLSRSPVRLTVEDAAAMHACRLQRHHGHGTVDLVHPGLTELESCERPGWGLGFRDEAGDLTHCMWVAHQDKIEDGPWSVSWMAWSTKDQLLELLGVVRSFGDQVLGVRISDPPGVSMQDMVERPFAWMQWTKEGAYDVRASGVAFRQHRICDMEACVAAVSLPGADLRFNLRIDDPIEAFLSEDAPWRGCGGDWTITLGAPCAAVAGHAAGLPVLEASINAFTRLWIGARRAQSLHLSDAMDGPGELLAALDRQYCLPEPAADWDY